MLPKEILIHTVLHRPITDSDSDDPYGTQATIELVCVQNDTSVRKYTDGQEIIGKAIMFWDYAQSTPATFNEDDEITFGEDVFYIGNIQKTDTPNGEHHLEILLK